LINTKLFKIHQEFSQFPLINQFPLHQKVTNLLQTNRKFQIISSKKNKSEQLKVVAIKLIENLLKANEILPNDLPLSDLLDTLFGILADKIKCIHYLINFDDQTKMTAIEEIEISLFL
jgi:hypothetical protein